MAGDALCACGLRPGIVASVSAERYKRRRKGDLCRDLRMLPNDTDEPIVFFGGKDYLPLFCDLTKDVKAKRTVFYNSGYAPAAQGCALVSSSRRHAPTGTTSAQEILMGICLSVRQR